MGMQLGGAERQGPLQRLSGSSSAAPASHLSCVWMGNDQRGRAITPRRAFTRKTAKPDHTGGFHVQEVMNFHQISRQNDGQIGEDMRFHPCSPSRWARERSKGRFSVEGEVKGPPYNPAFSRRGGIGLMAVTEPSGKCRQSPHILHFFSILQEAPSREQVMRDGQSASIGDVAQGAS
jgi:hypothetical protein